jgi:hypothetical protein
LSGDTLLTKKNRVPDNSPVATGPVVTKSGRYRSRLLTEK